MDHIETKSYDPQKVNLVVDGIAITGFAKGSMITVERNEDSALPYIGNQGDGAYAENADKSGKIKIVLMQTSPSVELLDRKSDEKGESAMFSTSIIDSNSGATNATGSDCRVLKPASKGYDKEVKEREFEIFAIRLNYV